MIEGIRGVIFDLDGTVIDSMKIWTEIDIEYLKRHGHELPDDLQSSLEGKSFEETAQYFKERFGIKDSLDVIMNEWNEMAYEFYSERVSTKGMVTELIEEFSKRGIPMALATSNSRVLAEAALKGHGLDRYISIVVTSSEVGKGKPNPDVFLKAAELIGIEPKSCVVFEDTYPGILGAKNAGMMAIGIYDEVSASVEEIKRDADHYIECYSEILKVM